MSIDTELSSQTIREQLHKILSGRTLIQSKRLVRFLAFVVEAGLKGEATQLNEYLIGIEVYERPASFDPKIDTIVRTEARRLRSKLRQYYETEGLDDPILIEIPKGSYAPVFRERQHSVLDKKPGTLISHYRLLEILGQGGMGTVFLARDLHLDRLVALKFIHAVQLKKKRARERFLREAKAAASIDHANVAAVYEVSEVDGHPFIVMAYVRGQSLQDRISEGLLEIPEAISIGCQLADGLEAAHRGGIVHRDLNPTNVILDDDHRVRIIDFGVAKLGLATQLTEVGTDLGTANYVSPEQMKGETVDHRTDIWSLGVILYELLTGRKPFEADHREALYYAIAYKVPEPMSQWREGIPEQLNRIVFRCLEKQPASRYSEVTALKTDLLRVKAEVPPTRNRASSTLSLPEDTPEADPKSSVEFRPNTLTPSPGLGPPSSPTGARESTLRHTGRFHSPGWTAGWIIGAALVILLVVAGSIWWFRTPRPPQPSQASTAVATSIPRLAVLPFESRSPGEGNQELSYAISDSVISSLTKLRGLQVTSWTSALRLTERRATLAEIAKALDIQFALEGSLLRSGEQGHVTAQLIRVSDDSHIWSDEFVFPWKDIMSVRRKIAESVVRQMKVQLRADEPDLLTRYPTKSFDAYQVYAKGRYNLIRFTYLREPNYLKEAERDFEEALQHDPRYTDVLADMGSLCYQRLYPPEGNRKELIVQGISYAERALAIDPNHVEALYILGSLYDHMGEASKGLQLCQKAIQLGPNNPEAHHHLAWRYLERGFYESGIAENSIAIEKDSLFMDPYFYKALFLARLGKYEEAFVVANQLKEVEPDSPFPQLLRADTAFCQGDLSRAETIWRAVAGRAPKRQPRSDITSVLLATISARRGQIEEARKVLDGFETTPSRANDYPIKLAALLGEKDLAIDLVRNSTLFRNYRWLISDPDIATLRDEPRFRELLYELYQKWRSDLAELAHSLPVVPPKLPTPEEYLSHANR